MKKTVQVLLAAICAISLFSCSVQKKLAKEAGKAIFSGADFKTANIGISLYDPAAKEYLYNYQSDKMFIPASNMKLFTCYAAMKYLGDSLVGLRYSTTGDLVTIEPAADPSFLMGEFANQPVLDFLKKQKNIQYYSNPKRKQFNAFGRGWAWDDYAEDYAQERSELPIYGNFAKFSWKDDMITVIPSFFTKNFKTDQKVKNNQFDIDRKMEDNSFQVNYTPGGKFSTQYIPFKTNPAEANPTYVSLLEDTLGVRFVKNNNTGSSSRPDKIIHSQPTDTLLKIMMHRSDNFFAEQTLLMVSNEKLGFMSDGKIIDTLLKSDLSGLPQKPKWVDGSGLSRYNLISPQDFVWVLTQMKNEFKWERIKEILPTGGEGTLSSSYKKYAGRIYAKTGTLSNHVALSGYLITNKGRELIFSVLVNAHTTSATAIRKGVEAFLSSVIEKY